MPEETIFMKIIKGEIPSTKIYEDENTYAFLDIQPNNLGHTLVIPKTPSTNIYKMSDEDVKTLFVVVKKISIAVKKGMEATGINIAMNNDVDAGQEVFHSHIHVIPRFPNDNFKHGRHLKYEDGQIETTAEKIRSNL